MKFIAIIPARYASSRFPGKPLADIGGKPMIQRVYEKTASCFEHTVVATDDRRIMRAVVDFGGRAVMTSDIHRSGTDRCAECLDIYERVTGEKFEVVVNVQGDEPFISGDHLSRISSAFRDPLVQIATLIKKFSPSEDIFDPNTPKVVVDNAGYAIYFSRSPVPYLRGIEEKCWAEAFGYFKHIGLYAYRADILMEITRLEPGKLETAESLEQLRWLENGYKIKVEETREESMAVDTPEDLQRVLQIMAGTAHDLQ